MTKITGHAAETELYYIYRPKGITGRDPHRVRGNIDVNQVLAPASRIKKLIPLTVTTITVTEFDTRYIGYIELRRYDMTDAQYFQTLSAYKVYIRDSKGDVMSMDEFFNSDFQSWDEVWDLHKEFNAPADHFEDEVEEVSVEAIYAEYNAQFGSDEEVEVEEGETTLEHIFLSYEAQYGDFDSWSLAQLQEYCETYEIEVLGDKRYKLSYVQAIKLWYLEGDNNNEETSSMDCVYGTVCDCDHVGDESLDRDTDDVDSSDVVEDNILESVLDSVEFNVDTDKLLPYHLHF